jgi:hypothetical protein
MLTSVGTSGTAADRQVFETLKVQPRSLPKSWLFAAHALHTGEGEKIMRSWLVYSAGIQVNNRFLLATIAMRAVRRLHINSTRTEETTNRVLEQIASGSFTDTSFPELTPAPAMEPVLIPVA